MEEQILTQVVGQVLIADSSVSQWKHAGTSKGLSLVKLIHRTSDNSYRIHGQKIDETKEVIIDSEITVDNKFNRATDTFVRWHDRQTFWGLNLLPRSRENPNEIDLFFNAIREICARIGNQASGQSHIVQQSQTNIVGEQLPLNQPLQLQSAATINQRPVQAQQPMTHPQVQQQSVHQSLLHQQQAQMMNIRMNSEPQPAAKPLLSQCPTGQVIQQHQPNQSLLQQTQMHPQSLQQQPPQSHNNQMNHYQHSHQQHIPQQFTSQQQIRQPPPQQQVHQQQPIQHPAQVVGAPVPAPPPPPPPPPAPPIAGLASIRSNGTPNSANSTEHPVNNGGSGDRNGGSPNQAVSTLANELAKCQLKKVNLSRSDSEKESECNNNNVGNPKTVRAASIGDSLMSEMNKKIASRREKLDQENNRNSNSISNGVSLEKGQESWLADLIRKEISKEMAKLRVEILEAIRTELKQR